MALRADDVDLGRDRDLVQRFQNGDVEAFNDLYRRYFGRLHRFCMRHTTDSHEAEEVAQEAFVRALGSMHRLEGERKFYPWMTVIAKRISIDRHRKLGRLELTEDPDPGVDPNGTELDHLFAAVDAQHVRTAMEQLGPRHREVLVLRETEGLSYADIAERLDVPMTTVEALLHRARKALRREYAKASGESHGLLAFPLLGWLGTKATAFRARMGDRWAEFAAIAAPAAAGVVTAAVLILPTQDTSQPVDAAAGSDPAAVETSVSEQPPAVPGEPLAVDAEPVTIPTATPAAPTAAAGPVDIFLGPEGADRARDEADEMPTSGTIGPAAAGVNPPRAVTDVADFVDGTLTNLLRAGTSSGQNESSLIGGRR